MHGGSLFFACFQYSVCRIKGHCLEFFGTRYYNVDEIYIGFLYECSCYHDY